MPKEIILDNFVFIESETDEKGIIQRANPDFIRISGYTEEELIGQPHNILRHPDMPKAAFKSLWDTIQNGETWKGIVKNKSKNGDWYWVKATVKPFTDKFTNKSGYISIRVPAKNSEIEEAEIRYKLLKENE